MYIECYARNVNQIRLSVLLLWTWAADVAVLQSLEQLEEEMLNGQKLQGPPTAAEVNAVLQQKGMEDRYDSADTQVSFGL